MAAPMTVAQMRQALQRGDVSAVELARTALDVVAADGHNAFVDVRPEVTLAQAAAADARRAALRAEGGDALAGAALLGIPVAHKDIFVTRDWASTAGSRMLAGYRSPFDATVVERLAQAGMVTVGKLNCDEFAMGSSNEHSVFGPVRNPRAPERIPGGSSGGSAAAVAAGLVPVTTGTDTGGSVRQPAAMCGITGIKPSYGRVSRWGMIAYASSLDQAGVLAHDADDCARVLQAMAGFDPRDSTSSRQPLPDLCAALGVCPPSLGSRMAARDAAGPGGSLPLRGLRIGLPDEFFGAGLEPDVRAAVEQGLAALRALGAQTVPISLPRTELAIPAYYVIAPAEASSNLSRFDGVRFGHRSSRSERLEDLYRHSRAEGFGAEVRRRILVGAYVLSSGYYDAYYRKAQQLRRLIAEDFDRVFADVDLIAGPVSPTVAWPLGERVDDPVREYLADIYTLPASLAGLPAMSLPSGSGAQGLPVGLQLIGPWGREDWLLATARLLQASAPALAAAPAAPVAAA